MRTSDRSERLVSQARAVRPSGVERRQILRVQLAFRFGGLLVLAAMSPVLEAVRMDVALVRISLFVLLYASVELLLMSRTSRILMKACKAEVQYVSGGEVPPPMPVRSRLPSDHTALRTSQMTEKPETRGVRDERAQPTSKRPSPASSCRSKNGR